MVPGSTLRYGSHFCRVTLKPRLSRRQPIEEAATPFPSEETTPPVTKIYFGAILIARVLSRACMPSTGLTYIQLWPQAGILSNRSVRSAKAIFLILPGAKHLYFGQGASSAESNTFPCFRVTGLKRRPSKELQVISRRFCCFLAIPFGDKSWGSGRDRLRRAASPITRPRRR